jgi:hypothetical protein
LATPPIEEKHAEGDATFRFTPSTSRTPLYGPDFINTDFSAIKHFVLPYRDGMRLDFRAEFFNVFNHAQFGLPGADISTASTFGALWVAELLPYLGDRQRFPMALRS